MVLILTLHVLLSGRDISHCLLRVFHYSFKLTLINNLSMLETFNFAVNNNSLQFLLVSQSV